MYLPQVRFQSYFYQKRVLQYGTSNFYPYATPERLYTTR